MLKIESRRYIIEKSRELSQIVAYGAGKRLQRLGEVFWDTEVWNKINYVIDSDEKKQGTEITVMGKALKIISLNELKNKNLSDYSIIITCDNYNDIINSFSTDCELSSIDYYCLKLIPEGNRDESALQKEIPSDIRLSGIPLIPKVIHYCWFGGNPLPDKYKLWMESWHKFCPDYQIIEWNENNYDVSMNAYMYQAYQNKKWGHVSDYARLDLIYRYGGIYLDTDVELVQNLDDLLYQKGFAGFENDEQVALGLGFGAVKGLPIIKELLDLYSNMQFINEDGSLNMTGCPILQTPILEKHHLKKNGEYQIVEDLTIYPEKVLCGKSLATKKIVLKPYTRAIHHYAGSWASKEDRDHNMWLETMQWGKEPPERVFVQ